MPVVGGPRRKERAAWPASVGGLIGGFVLYALLTVVVGAVDFKSLVTLDQAGRLELEGLAIFYGVVLGACIGTPLGVYVALRVARARRAGLTAIATLLTTPAATALAVWIIPTRPDDPVLLPYGVFGSWFIVPLLMRWLVEKVR